MYIPTVQLVTYQQIQFLDDIHHLSLTLIESLQNLKLLYRYVSLNMFKELHNTQLHA